LHLCSHGSLADGQYCGQRSVASAHGAIVAGMPLAVFLAVFFIVAAWR
jgi:hypothetical protein